MSKEDLSREQAIVDQAQKMQVLDELKAYPGQENKEAVAYTPEQLMTISEYIHYLENQVNGYQVGMENPPAPRGAEWVQKDIQIIMRDAGKSDFLEKAKIMNISGRVLIHRSERDFIRAVLDEAPETMRFTLIEEMPRVQKKIVSATTSERNVTVLFDDGSKLHIPLPPEEKEEDEWDL